MNNFTSKSFETVAKTIYGEARGEYFLKTGGLPSLIAVANVINNRYQKSETESVEEICLKPKQFSCWNREDPNLHIMQNVEANEPIYRLCQKVAQEVLIGNWPDITKGATHYYSSTMKKPPYWAIENAITIKIGQHIFIKL